MKIPRLNQRLKIVRYIVGICAVVFYLAYVIYFYCYNDVHNMLWACHLACLLTGMGLLINSPMLNATGFFWLVFGVPLWLVNVFSGDIVFAASVFTHIGGLAAGTLGVLILGMPRRSWLVATLALPCLLAVSRGFTPPELNINLAFSVWKGFEKMFPSHLIYIIIIGGFFAVVSFIAENIAVYVLKRIAQQGVDRQ